MTKQLKVAGVGAGFFNEFQYKTWTGTDSVDLAAVCGIHDLRARDDAAPYRGVSLTQRGAGKQRPRLPRKPGRRRVINRSVRPPHLHKICTQFRKICGPAAHYRPDRRPMSRS
jgi:hypothetical protein